MLTYMLLRNGSLHEKIFLRAIVAEFHRTGVEEALFARVYKQHLSLCRFEGRLKCLECKYQWKSLLWTLIICITPNNNKNRDESQRKQG